MKSTNERLSDAAAQGRACTTEEQYNDLIHDRIATWRLLEDGWTPSTTLSYEFEIKDAFLTYYQDTNKLKLFPLKTNAFIKMDGLKTYTQLLNLIEMIG